MKSLKKCRECGIEAYTRDDLETFTKSHTCTYGRDAQCKKCAAAAATVKRANGITRSAAKLPKEVAVTGLRKCTKCSKEAFTSEDLIEFQKASNSKYGYANLCRKCAVIKTTTNLKKVEEMSDEELTMYRTAQRRWHLKKAYNITLEDFDEMVTEQGNLCKICKCSPKSVRNFFRDNLVVDHCHTTGKIRGLLCSQCNIGLGSFKDSLELVTSAATYLN